YIIQPSPFNIESLLFQILLRFVPSPDLVIHLDAPPELVYRRKSELALSEIERQAAVCKQIVSILPHGHTVDSSLPLKDVVSQIRHLVIVKMASRSSYQSIRGAL
ncbi:hypothetical protein ACFLYR_06740, partial [Chloroflexota bacterium]